MKYITVSGEDITSVHDSQRGSVPEGAIAIGEETYEMFGAATYGFGEFIYRDHRVVRRDPVQDARHLAQNPPLPSAEESYGLRDLVVELLTLLEVSNVICKDNLSFEARRYLGLPDSTANTFGKALGHPDFNGIGGDLV